MVDAAGWARAVAGAWAEAGQRIGGVTPPADPVLAPTPKAAVHRDGTATLYRFLPPSGEARSQVPLLLVPSLINKWYVLDLRPGGSLVEALVGGGIDTFCLDWGVPEAEDRHLSWDEVLARLARAVRRVRRVTGASRVALLGYCMGGTLATIHAALEPDGIAALIDLAGPIDFGKAGRLATMVDSRWFDADAIADAGNVEPSQMQSGFVALRPTLDLQKAVMQPDLWFDPAARDAARALEIWASDNIPFPGEAYRTYITDLYQANALVLGRHVARGQRVDLQAIRCPTLSIVAERDNICPPEAACALGDRVGGKDHSVIRIPGGHVGAVVGRAAAREMYPKVLAWLQSKTSTSH